MTATARPDYMLAADAIKAQLGGAAVMLGATNFIGGQNDARSPYLSFKIGRNDHKVTHIRITLEPTDTYRVEFLRCYRFDCKTLADESMVYADRLRATIEQHTGMRCSL